MLITPIQSFLCLTMNKVPLILRCVTITVVASFEGS